MIYFPLILKAGATIAIATRARSVYYESASVAPEIPIRVVMQGGAGSEYMLKVGQGFRAGQDYEQLLVTNPGASDITGNLVLADAGFFDNRVVGTVNISGIVTVSGNVNTIDAGYGRSKAATSFVGGILYQPGGGYANIQLWNPVGSGKTLIVASAIYLTADASRIYMFKTTQALGALGPQQPIAKRFDSAAVTVGQVRQFSSGTQTPAGGTQFWDSASMANKQQRLQFADPIVLAPGVGLSICAPWSASSYYLSTIFDYYEE